MPAPASGPVACVALTGQPMPPAIAGLHRAGWRIAAPELIAAPVALLMCGNAPDPVERETIIARAAGLIGPTILIGAMSPAVSAYLLERGVADIVGPDCDTRELAARLRLRMAERTRTVAPLIFGPLTVDRVTMAVTCADRVLAMPRREAELLAYLIAYAERAVPTRELRRALWRLDFDPRTNSVAVHMSRLRGRLHDASDGMLTITSRRGIGYRLTTSHRWQAGGTVRAAPPVEPLMR